MGAWHEPGNCEARRPLKEDSDDQHSQPRNFDFMRRAIGAFDLLKRDQTANPSLNLQPWAAIQDLPLSSERHSGLLLISTTPVSASLMNAPDLPRYQHFDYDAVRLPDTRAQARGSSQIGAVQYRAGICHAIEAIGVPTKVSTVGNAPKWGNRGSPCELRVGW